VNNSSVEIELLFPQVKNIPAYSWRHVAAIPVKVDLPAQFIKHSLEMRYFKVLLEGIKMDYAAGFQQGAG